MIPELGDSWMLGRTRLVASNRTRNMASEEYCAYLYEQCTPVQARTDAMQTTLQSLIRFSLLRVRFTQDDVIVAMHSGRGFDNTLYFSITARFWNREIGRDGGLSELTPGNGTITNRHRV
jgi:hypothetical protein